MKRLLKRILLVTFCSFLILPLQAEKTDSIAVKKSGFVAGLNYLSNNVYLGRIDSANIMYLSPSIAYYHKSGLHFGASMSYQLNAGSNKIDAVALEGGYDFKLNDNLSGGLSVEKYFYDINSIALNSVNDLGVGSNFSYDFSVVTLNVGAGLAFNDQTDIITNAGLNHTFEFDKFAIEPSILFNAGTQNFYNSYLKAGKSHKNGNNGKGKGNSNTSTITYSIEQASRFKILDYEISIPVSYTLHNLKFNLVPTYFIPVNAATILSSKNTTVEKEVISNHFVVQLGVTYKF